MKKFLLLFLILLLFTVSCSKKEVEEKPNNEEINLDVNTPPEVNDNKEVILPVEPEIDPTKTEISLLTGLPCTPEIKNNRPIAIMINNLHASFPQESLSKADIIYECDMEGGVTRLMGIFSDLSDVKNIGSMRSARDYFIEIANSHDAVFVHAGGSPSAYTKIKDSGIDNIDGVNMYSVADTAFWRDNNRIKECGYEHSMMTSGDKLNTAIDFLKYRTSLENVSSFYNFNSEFTELSTDKTAKTVTLEHSEYLTVEFNYDDKIKKYLKNSFGQPHIDGSNGEQLSFSNLLILYVKEKVVDEEGRLNIDINSEGTGVYICAGKCIDINWSKAKDGAMFCFTCNGEDLKLNPGKTHISLFNKNRKEYVTIN